MGSTATATAGFGFGFGGYYGSGRTRVDNVPNDGDYSAQLVYLPG